MARILIACEYSGHTREAFRALGHDAVSCDLLPADDNSPHHIQGDVFDVIANHGPWDMMLAHPPCTYLASSGLHWNKRVEGRAAKTEEALQFVARLMAADIPHIAIENPVGCISTRLRKADQYIQPYDFGDDASKRTGLWLKGLPTLVADPAARRPGRIVESGKYAGKERWSNQTDSGQNALPPSADRWKVRSTTYVGWSTAMAAQWGAHLNQQLAALAA